MANDRAKHTVLPLTKFGLMQITRQRLREEVSFQTSEPCPVCQGTGEIIDSFQIIETIEEVLRQIAALKKYSKLTLTVHPFIYAYLKRGFYSILLQWRLKYFFNLKLKQNKDFHIFEFQFTDNNDKKITL